MSDRIPPISLYVSEERRAEIKQRAKEEDTSMSEFINDVLDQYLQQEAQDTVVSETHAEERIQELITSGTETMMETATEIRKMNARIGAYTIANFELQKRDRSDHVQKEALRSGADRIRQDLDTAIQELAEPSASTEPKTEPIGESPEPDPTQTADDIVDAENTCNEAESDTGEDFFDKLRRDRE